MADDPIVIDDGGSPVSELGTEVGNSVGEMDGLLGVIANVGAPAAGR